MDLRAPCNFCTSLYYRKPAPSPHRRQLPTSPETNNNNFSSSRTSKLGRRITTTSELQTPQVGIPAGTTTTTTTTDYSPSIPSHKVTVHDTHLGITHEFFVPEDQYILHTAEAQNISLPFACRHGCCTSCAVRIKSGQLRQPEALGISAELKAKGYALLCVGYPSSDIEVETQDEDEVYWLQFGRYFARGPIERDDYALELAMGDE